jgi:cysteinyl-tRNA synthetase
VLRLHDTAKGQVVDVELRDPGKVSMYVCGPTVYDDPHIGHGRFVLVWDVIRRYLEWCGYQVRYVSNITDIEDKIIRRSLSENRPADEIVRIYEKAWWDAMDRLGVMHPDEEPHATAYVDRMVDYIANLIDRNHAYVAEDGVYFEVASLPDYGLLARQSLDSLRSGARVEVDEAKRSPLDFALWKRAKPGEPTWESPWGDGRPGWHIECTVMALDLLGDEFDLHGGGNDLAFPHHENERAQARAAGHGFARHWVHSGMVTRGGEEMHKSLGNSVSLPEMLDRIDPRAYRLLVLRAHYRSPMEVTEDTLNDAEAGLARLDSFARHNPDVAVAPDAAVIEQFKALMDDDLRTPSAVALIFDQVNAANKGDERAAATVFELCGAIGLDLRRAPVAVDAETQRLVDERDGARQRKDYATSDRIRADLEARGWIVEDGAGGTVVHR